MKPTVLIADDSEFVRGALAEALRAEEIAVVVARNGKEALESLAKSPEVRALVLKVKMPIDGCEVLKRLVRPAGHPLYVVAVGNQGDQRLLDACLALGADAVLVKPVDTAKLGGLLRQALEGGQPCR